jgi:signal transduction histidine kinase
MAFHDLRRWHLERRARRRAQGSTLRAFAPGLDGGMAQALVELSSKVGTNWEESVRRIVAFDAEVLHVERVSFWSLNEEASSIHCEAGYIASMESFEHGASLFEAEMPGYFAAMRLGRAIAIHDVGTDQRCRGLLGYCSARGIASMLDIPVWVEGRLRGVLCHEHVGLPRHWSSREEDLATSLSQVVASSLAARAHTRAEAAARRAAFLDNVSLAMSSLDAREVAERTLSACVPWLGDLCLLWVQNAEGVLELLAVKHYDPVKHEMVVRHQQERALVAPGLRPTLAARVVRQGQSIIIPEATQSVFDRYGISPPDRTVIKTLDLSTAMGVPTSCRETTGALVFLASRRRYDSDDLAVAEDVGARLGAALENARLYAVAREAIRARDDLLVLAAHELRTPLTALQLTTDQMLRKARRAANASEVSRVEPMARHVRRFGALVNHVIEALSIRAEGITLTCSSCDLARIARERVTLVTETALAAGSPITIEGASSLQGMWDRARVEVVIDALLDNAVKFGAGRPIVVTLRSEGLRAEVSVSDQGIGISSDRTAAIFHPFERAVSKEHYGGLGLGLYVAKAVVDAHGGSIAVTSAPGEGATFVVRLPLASPSRSYATG